MTIKRRANLAILPWGYFFEEYLDPLGITVEQFCTTVSGSWLFNFVRALGTAGIDTTVVLFSRDAERVRWYLHGPTGARMCVLPARRWFRAPLKLRNRLSTALTGRSRISRALLDLARYSATPVLPLMRALRRGGCDGILCQEYEYPRFEVCVAIGRMLGIPVFATFQGGLPGEGVLQPRLRPRAIRRCSGLIIGAVHEAERVHEAYSLDWDRIGVIQNPIALEEIPAVDRQAARRALGIDPAVPVAIWHGRVSMYTKGLDLLVEAWRSVADGRPDARLILIGSGGDDDILRRAIAPELAAGTIIWVDRYVQDRLEVSTLLSAGDVYMFPSRHEGFPVAPLEAMACGLPVIAGQASGVREILGRGEPDGGLQVRAGDAAALATATAALLDDPERARTMGAAARLRMERHFSVPAIGARLGAWLAGRGFPVQGAGA
jgi:glycosyltransferase involved in cell wall biosynthesis